MLHSYRVSHFFTEALLLYSFFIKCRWSLSFNWAGKKVSVTEGDRAREHSLTSAVDTEHFGAEQPPSLCTVQFYELCYLINQFSNWNSLLFIKYFYHLINKYITSLLPPLKQYTYNTKLSRSKNSLSLSD